MWLTRDEGRDARRSSAYILGGYKWRRVRVRLTYLA